MIGGEGKRAEESMESGAGWVRLRVIAMKKLLKNVGNNRRMKLNRRISVAPMMDWTDRHCRYFLRGFAPDTLLYTEMITTGAVLRGDREKLLRFDAEEHPVALQLGGSDPADLAAAARIGADMGYDEINLNCGCPSDRVHSGAFGACLMKKPSLVAECVAAMRAAVTIPVTVKLRIGVVDGAEIGGEGMTRRESAREAAARFGARRTGRARGIRRRHRRRGLRRHHRACAQGGARRLVAARQPRDSAAAL